MLVFNGVCPMGDVLVFFCVYNVCGPNVCECVCVLRLADLCVCELSQSLSLSLSLSQFNSYEL